MHAHVKSQKSSWCDWDGNGTLEMLLLRKLLWTLFCSRPNSYLQLYKPFTILYLWNVSIRYHIFLEIRLELLCMHCIVCREREQRLELLIKTNTRIKNTKHTIFFIIFSSPPPHSPDNISGWACLLICSLGYFSLSQEHDVMWGLTGGADCPRLHSWFQTPIHTTCLTASIMSSSAGL